MNSKGNKKGINERILSIVLAGFVFLLVLGAVPSIVSAADPTVMVTDYTVRPSVLASGGSGTITIILTNTASSASIKESSGISTSGEFQTTKNVDISAEVDTIELVGNGLKVVDGDYHQFGSIGPGQSVNVTFSIEAPAKEGLYFPEVWVGINGGKNVHYPIPVNVNTDEFIMKTPTVVVGKEIPESVNPGESFPVTLTFTNAGVIRVSEIVLSTTTSSTSIGAKGPNTIALGSLNGGENQTIVLDFVTDKNVPLGLQKINLGLNYKLPDGAAKHQDEIIEVPVKGKAELNIASITTEPKTVSQGDDVTLIIRLENTGTDTAKSVSASIDLPMDGSKEAFIGKIQPNNDAPAIFSVKVRDAGDLPYALMVTYNDEWGQHNNTIDLHLAVKPADGTVIIISLVAVAAVIIASLLYLRKRRSK